MHQVISCFIYVGKIGFVSQKQGVGGVLLPALPAMPALSEVEGSEAGGRASGEPACGEPVEPVDPVVSSPVVILSVAKNLCRFRHATADHALLHGVEVYHKSIICQIK